MCSTGSPIEAAPFFSFTCGTRRHNSKLEVRRAAEIMDRLTPEARSRLMSQIKGKDTKPEMAVRSYLHARGLRYRLHDRSLPGKPDLVFKSRKVVIFVHGCFWHGHIGCKQAHIPKSREEYWRTKIETNAARDRRSIRRLRSLGWHVFVVWECRICEKRLRRLYCQIAGAEQLPAPLSSPLRHDAPTTRPCRRTS